MSLLSKRKLYDRVKARHEFHIRMALRSRGKRKYHLFYAAKYYQQAKSDKAKPLTPVGTGSTAAAVEAYAKEESNV